ncbi:MAG: hypothetical protein WB660_17770, partial [Candidatus Sulfotelmatobacter sp.]
YRPAPDRRAGKPRTAWVCGWHRAGAQSAAAAGHGAAGRFDQPALPFQLGGGYGPPWGGNRQLLLAQQDGQLVLAPARVAQAQGENAIR